MENRFYKDFDTARVEESQRFDDYRTPFQIDRDRIIYSSEFRRLQGKTQVFLPGEYDFYRTRLTHSIEVAQIGRSICTFLIKSDETPFTDDYHIDHALVEAACLSHDIGHPPFGHAGERTLNRLMHPYGGFEGNAQTLRILTEVLYRDGKGHRGMKPTRALLDSILKYKVLHEDTEEKDNHFLYDFQKKYRDYAFGGHDFPAELADEKKLNKFRSIECQIMDWADDTAYANNDIVDSISGGFISILKLNQWAADNPGMLEGDNRHYFDEIIEWIKTGNYKKKFGAMIGACITGCKVEERDTFMNGLTNRYKYKLVFNPEVTARVNFYKLISTELVFKSSLLHQSEYRGDFMISGIFNLLKDKYLIKKDEGYKEVKILPEFTHSLLRNEPLNENKIRLICDYVSGMTDSFAVRTYKRLFDPDYSSLAELA